MDQLENLYVDALRLLKSLIATPSFSREEDKTALLISSFLQEKQIPFHRKGNNVWATNQFFDEKKPNILLNSHHDTVKPNPAYTRDPFAPDVADGKLFGLGSNDAGGPLVALIAAFINYYPKQNLRYNIILAATAEEEISGFNGIESIWSELPEIAFAIVGEPTLTDMAIAEKGLMVLDCVSKGKAGHAAREEGVNALYEALPDIEWFRTYRFPKISAVLGEVKMSVTIISAGLAHNQVPPECKFTVDVRVTDDYSLEEIVDVIRKNVRCTVTPRSMRFRSSGIERDHVLVKAGVALGRKLYGSPTTSDQALIPSPSVKIGPGDSARSHSADEFIYLEEILEGIRTYIGILDFINSQTEL